MIRECGVCWWVYDPSLGDDDAQVPAGVQFDDLPDDYTCPRCHAPKVRFLRQRISAPIGELVSAYRAIDHKMRDLPIYNTRLVVEPVGFGPCGELVVGMLVTPWFINLVIFGHPLPRTGDTLTVSLPGGDFDALGASVDGVEHLAVALLSPVNHLANQDAARAVAQEALRLVLGGVEVETETEEAAPNPSKATGRRGLFGALLGG
jgi:[NiFe] hydrogenase assembly HybE family chaperone